MGNRLSKIYTRTGDDGTTGLANGERIAKADRRVAAFGDVDETNSALGLLLTEPDVPPAIETSLARIQHELFEIGAELSLPGYRQITAEHISRLEHELDELNVELPPLEGIRAARRHACRSDLPPRAHDLPARRAQRLGGEDADRAEPGAAALSQPVVGSAVRHGAQPGAAERRPGNAVATIATSAPRSRADASARPNRTPAPDRSCVRARCRCGPRPPHARATDRRGAAPR